MIPTPIHIHKVKEPLGPIGPIGPIALEADITFFPHYPDRILKEPTIQIINNVFKGRIYTYNPEQTEIAERLMNFGLYKYHSRRLRNGRIAVIKRSVIGDSGVLRPVSKILATFNTRSQANGYIVEIMRK